MLYRKGCNYLISSFPQQKGDAILANVLWIVEIQQANENQFANHREPIDELLAGWGEEWAAVYPQPIRSFRPTPPLRRKVLCRVHTYTCIVTLDPIAAKLAMAIRSLGL